MKVTVRFGNVRVVVPCGNGDLLVRELIDKAIQRYRKATGKDADSWVFVHNLKSFSDGGILDPDDKLHDVADDREQLLAMYEEQGGTVPLASVINGDGTSASSVGTDSPDIFQVGEGRCFSNDVEITPDTVPLGIMSLQVRRGSEPALNRLSPVLSPVYVSDSMKRWSAAVLDDQGSAEATMSIHDDDDDDDPSDDENEKIISGDVNDRTTAPFSRFSHDMGRLSILGNTMETIRWVEAADRQLSKTCGSNSNYLNPEFKPVGILKNANEIQFEPQEVMVMLKNENGPLGIHVVPDYDANGRDAGLLVQGIEPGGRIDRDGRLQVLDRIIEINDQSLLNINFQRAQEIFKEALRKPDIKIRLSKAPENIVATGSELASSEMNKKTVATAPARSTNTMLVSNTRKLGKKINIQLTKGSDGLGFSVTTRDNLAGGNCPIYIKNILPKGAAIEDGRLKPGDRLLEVNGIEMTGKTQAEAVTILRTTPLGGGVSLVVSRQETESPKLPRELTDSVTHVHPNEKTIVNNTVKREKPEDSAIFPWKHREVLTFDIPLNDTGSAGLGVSVKGKTSTAADGTMHLGIFVKSVIHGGAASKDGRLKENDQLISVNGASLLGKSNMQAMETLRQAIQQEGPNPDAITLTIARRVPSPHQHEHSSKENSNVNSESTGFRLHHSPSPDKMRYHQKGGSLMSPDIDRNMNNKLYDQKIEDKDLGLDVPLRNPVIDRLIGQPTFSALRNESYYCATNRSWSSSPSSNDSGIEHSKLCRLGSMTSPTTNLTMDDTLIIEDDNYPPSINSGSLVASDKTEEGVNVTDGGRIISQEVKLDATNMSQMSLDDAGKTFSRDGFGRQSMSEKRHAQLDAKNTDTYQRNKKAREEREKQRQDINDEITGDEKSCIPMIRVNSADSLIGVVRSSNISTKKTKKDVGPVLKMKKSSSLESLQTMIAEVNLGEERDENFSRPNVVSVRSRGCNESFRAAVDRSYDVPAGTLAEKMETLDEESESGSSGLGRGTSRHSSLTGEFLPEDIYQFGKKSKKKGIFKGLGSVFKFGKNRKLTADHLPRLTIHDLERQKVDSEKQRARKAAQEEQERIHEQYRKLLRQMEPQNSVINNNNNNHLSKEENLDKMLAATTNRQERMNLLRAQYQRKHQERQGVYPGEMNDAKKKESVYGQIDRQTKNRFLKKDPTRYSFQLVSPTTPIHRRANSQIHSQRYDSDVVHARSHSYDQYKESGRPATHTNAVDAEKYSHYANYEEIQHHLKQQQKSRPTSHERPASNYYEYESIQSAFRTYSSGDGSTNSLPRPTLRKRSVQPLSSNPLDSTRAGSSRRDKESEPRANYEPLPGKQNSRCPKPFVLGKYDPVGHQRHMTKTSSKV